MNVRIPTKHYKVLLVQLMVRFTEALMVTFCGSSSTRYRLTEIVLAALKDLERELKKDCTLRESSIAKKKMFDCLYTGHIPAWFERIFMEALREESVKLDNKTIRPEPKEIEEFWKGSDQVKEPEQVNTEKKLEDAVEGDVWSENSGDYKYACKTTRSKGVWENTKEDLLKAASEKDYHWTWGLLISENRNLKYCGNILTGTFKDV